MIKITKISLIKYLIFMKLIILFLLLSVVNVNAEVLAQTITLSKKNASIESVFKEIKKQTQYNLICDISIIEETPNMDVSAKNMPLNQFLDQFLGDNNVSYVIEEKTIAVRKAVPPARTSRAQAHE